MRVTLAESVDSSRDKTIISVNLVYFGHFGHFRTKTWGLEAILGEKIPVYW